MFIVCGCMSTLGDVCTQDLDAFKKSYATIIKSNFQYM